ncbi:two-component system histidine kinase PnpS [Paenibacillus physcomitrellae]|uniref:histidine kinase n=1 Tax=Paenibacillus physcomitrellae TaxID=1619311 RepID=A0ABQ1GSE6_9BACL|nr:ATP-binding protein [Paenibacillus physcomitrellae]GGA48717.1 PAS domain-containing sensor histidine kinase [Paenibacillus physcomitrellae]
MKSFRTRLAWILMGLVGISMCAAGLTMAKVFKDSHISVLEDNMAREINVLSSTFAFRPAEDNPDALSYYSSKAVELDKLTGLRVTFIRSDGLVIGDSESNASEMENHLNRHEIKTAGQAGSGNPGTSIRFSDTIKEDMLYVAEKVTSNQGFDGYIRLAMSLHTVKEGLWKAWSLMIGGLLILFVAAGLFSYRLAYSITKPLNKITQVANRISRLDYDARVYLQRRVDEIGQLGGAINRMADSLQQQLKIIRENEDLLQSVLANMTGGIIIVDVEGHIALVNRAACRILRVREQEIIGRPYQEIKRSYELTKFIEEGVSRRGYVSEELTVYDPEEKILRIDVVPMYEEGDGYRGMLFHFQDVTEIRKLERMRSEFVANVSHELKTPIAAVQGFAETLLTGEVKDEETARSFLQIIYDEGDRLNRLIGDILELSKIESRQVPLAFEPIEVRPLIESLFEVLKSAADKKSISLKLEVPEGMFMEGDEDRLRQIFMNLLSNAISYTPDGGRVKLAADILDDEEEEKIRFVISDTGIGIPKKDLPRIFERFYRVDKARSRSSGGTGLGLSIVKHLVDLNHGTIKVESKVGEGTSFILDLPMVQHID